jgi:RNA polymerase sigma-70 factor (ECF subfamily)
MDPNTGQKPEDLIEPGSQLFDQFTRRLVGLARKHLDTRLQHKIEPEDVVQSVYKSFFLRYGEGLLQSENLDGLWSLLTVITLRKCADRVRYHQAQRRNIAREARGPSNDSQFGPGLETAGREPTPEEAVVLAETVEQVLRGLDEHERPIIELSLQGYSTPEISEKLGRAERSVRRLRERVRLHLSRLQEEGSR